MGHEVGELDAAHLPSNCIPITPVTTANFVVTGLAAGTVLFAHAATTGTQITCKRTGFPLDGAMAVSDYYAQG